MKVGSRSLRSSAMKDLGQPSSYVALQERVPVYSSDGKELGEIEHVLADPDLDVFDGIVLDKSVLPGGRFVDASQVEEIYERGVVLRVDAAEAEGLPEPSASPAQIEVGPNDMVKDDWHDKLRRAWDRISGKD